ncbi:hypothetical protein [Paenibacillus crassostreae]|uniref:hypothetical protein n=1 Tax=Paenibacillus crassostreae TaxID=1763538 RepID=UPI000A4A506F|nr:hypothetical protein [Paenibacillus crassostreae]
MLRVPANVKGDGKHTIEELVIEKNRDPLRGRDHRTPLEIIQLGELENLMLKGQGYRADSIPKVDEIIYLRENSNVSTGGDSIDVTDEISDYKKIAVDAVSALGAKISGIDLIIENKDVPAANNNAYGIIEANFNPSMYMHTSIQRKVSTFDYAYNTLFIPRTTTKSGINVSQIRGAISKMQIYNVKFGV